jgi:serine/threonine protein kinase
LKLSNILFNVASNAIKLSDFGCGIIGKSRKDLTEKLSERNQHSYIESLFHRAPEILLRFQNLNELIDVWSVGCIFVEIITRVFPFEGKNEDAMIVSIFKAMGFYSNEEFWELCTHNSKTDIMTYCSRFQTRPLRDQLLECPCDCEQTRNYVTAFLRENTFFPQMLERLLCCDPNRRRGASKVLQSEYFKA